MYLSRDTGHMEIYLMYLSRGNGHGKCTVCIFQGFTGHWKCTIYREGTGHGKCLLCIFQERERVITGMKHVTVTEIISSHVNMIRFIAHIHEHKIF